MVVHAEPCSSSTVGDQRSAQREQCRASRDPLERCPARVRHCSSVSRPARGRASLVARRLSRIALRALVVLWAFAPRTRPAHDSEERVDRRLAPANRDERRTESSMRIPRAFHGQEGPVARPRFELKIELDPPLQRLRLELFRRLNSHSLAYRQAAPNSRTLPPRLRVSDLRSALPARRSEVTTPSAPPLDIAADARDLIARRCFPSDQGIHCRPRVATRYRHVIARARAVELAAIGEFALRVEDVQIGRAGGVVGRARRLAIRHTSTGTRSPLLSLRRPSTVAHLRGSSRHRSS